MKKTILLFTALICFATFTQAQKPARVSSLYFKCQSDPPLNPKMQQIYLDCDDDKLYTWDGTSWMKLVDLSNYVDLTTNQTLTGIKTFTEEIILNTSDGAIELKHSTLPADYFLKYYAEDNDMDLAKGNVLIRAGGKISLPNLTVGDITNDKDVLIKEYYDSKTGQIGVTTAITLTNLYNGKTIWLNSATAFNIIIDDTLDENFECYFYNVGVGTVTFVAGTGVLDAPDGVSVLEDGICMIIKKQFTNDYKLKGQLE